MVHIEFGPNLDGSVNTALEYAAYKQKNVLEFFKFHNYDEEEKDIQFVIKPGHWTIDDVEIKYEAVATHVTDCRLVSEVKGYFKAANISIINKFFEIKRVCE
jgi:hypothetical protein